MRTRTIGLPPVLVETPIITSPSSLTSFGIIGPDVQRIGEIRGDLVGFAPNSLLGGQLDVSSLVITALVCDSEWGPVVKLDPVIAAYRYLRKLSEDEFFAFTVNQRKVENKIWCFCLRGVEVVPFEEDSCIVVPVTYVVTSELLPSINSAKQSLDEIKKQRFDQMRHFWSSKWCAKEGWFNESVPSSFPLLTNCSAQEETTAWMTWHLFRYCSSNSVMTLLLAVLCEYKVMVISSSLATRSRFVNGLMALFSSCALVYPHPVLAAAPYQIARELPHAPTPVIAGIPKCATYGRKSERRNSSRKNRLTGFNDTVFVDLDDGGPVYSFDDSVATLSYGKEIGATEFCQDNEFFRKQYRAQSAEVTYSEYLEKIELVNSLATEWTAFIQRLRDDVAGNLLSKEMLSSAVKSQAFQSFISSS